MHKPELTAHDLKRELNEFREQFPKLSNDQLFILWFLRAYVTEDDMLAVEALCGGPNDKGIDAILVDSETRTVFVVQGKYHAQLGKHSENHADVVSFAQIGQTLAAPEKELRELVEGIAPDVHARIMKARSRILKDNYRLRLYYVTTGKCSIALAKEAKNIAQQADRPTTCEVFAWKQVLATLDFYLRDVAPPIGSLDLELESGLGVAVKSIYHRYDEPLDIESWVFSMSVRGIAKMYAETGIRLFALNIRGYQGDATVNQDIEKTLRDEPGHFWYYNNGLTIICDGAEKISSHGKDVLRVSHPQVINGQQTTLTIDKVSSSSSKASVTVRVIRVPHEDRGTNYYDTLVPEIVKATNWQNKITTSDLISNERRQIEIQRQLRKMGYWYVRKRQPKQMAKKEAGAQHYFMLDKDDLARAVAGCNLDPAIVRGGKEKLFGERMYDQIFPTADPYYYLCRYWLMTCVSYAARGYPERAYAKWLVLNLIWSRLSLLVQSRARGDRLRKQWETSGVGLTYLWQANTAAFKAALLFFRLRRGKGAKAADVSSFFKRKNLHVEFEKFWRGPANKHRAVFQKAWLRFNRTLTEETK